VVSAMSSTGAPLTSLRCCVADAFAFTQSQAWVEPSADDPFGRTCAIKL